MIYLLDSDTCVELLRRREPTASSVEAHSPADLAISTVTEAELEYGILLHPNPEGVRARLDRLLAAPIEILPFDRGAARVHARVRAELRPHPIGPHDLIIASVALTHRLVLVTHNTREFRRVPGLRIEDWTEPEP